MADGCPSLRCGLSVIFLLISWLIWIPTSDVHDSNVPGITIQHNLKYTTVQLRCIRYFRSRTLYDCNSTSSFNVQALCLLCSNDVESNLGDFRKNNQLISVFYQNARSLKAAVKDCDEPRNDICKLSLLQDIVYSADYDLVAITETWLNPTISCLEILPHGYDIYRKDREDRIGGGVLLAARNTIAVKSCVDFPGETIAVEIKLASDKLLLFVVCYKAPNNHEFLIQFKVAP